MNQALHIGPLALPAGVLLTLLATATAWLLGRVLLPRDDGAGAAFTHLLERTLLVALVVARVAFVLEYRDAYGAAPWRVLDIRDGGWQPQAGLIAAWIYALARLRQAAGLRRPVTAALVAASVVWLAGAVALAISGPQGRPLPGLVTTTLEGQPKPLAAFAGQPVVINLWATWCPPCRREMPVLQQAQRQHTGVHFVFLNQGETAATVRHYLARSGLELHNVLLDPRREVAREFEQSALPTTLFFDAQGRLVSLRVGELSEATLAQRLQALAPGDRGQR